MSETLKVLRLQLVNKQTFVWMPLIVLAGAVLLSILVFGLIPYEGVKWSGAAQAPLWYLFVVGTMALTRTFPFSQALSVTRRDYLLGTLLTATITCAGLATLFLVGTVVERLTKGWGLNGYVFTFDPFLSQGPIVAWFAYLVSGLLIFVSGVLSATVYKRFGSLWLTVAWIVGVAAVVAGAALVSSLVPLATLGTWAAAQTVLSCTAYGAVLLVGLVAITHLVLRRTLP